MIGPLRWPFPFIPFLNKQNEDLLSSPIPLIACVSESGKLSSSDLYSEWTGDAEGTSTMHFNLDNNKRVGELKVDLRLTTKQKGVYQKLKDTRLLIQDEYPHDYMLKDLYDDKKKNLVKHLGQFVNILKEVVRSIYFKDLELSLYDPSRPEDFNKIKQNCIANSEYDKKSMEVLLSSQSFQMYLDKHASTAPPKDQ